MVSNSTNLSFFQMKSDFATEFIDLLYSNIKDLFRIVGGSVIFISILFFVEFTCSSRKFAVAQKSAGVNESIALDESKETKTKAKKLTRFELELSGLLFLFFIMCVGSEITFAQFIYTFTQQELAPLLNTTDTWLANFFLAKENTSAYRLFNISYII